MTDTKEETGRLPPISSATPIQEEEPQPAAETAAPAAQAQQPEFPSQESKGNLVQPESLSRDKTKLIDTSAAPSSSTLAEPKKPAKKPRSKEDRDESFKFILGYAKRECGSISLGILFLIGGSLSDLAVPLFIGRVIDYIQKGDYDAVGTLCLYMLIVILVSS